MSGSSPYQPPLQQGPPSIPVAMTGTPPVVTVFAILHLVFAGIGTIGALWGLFIAVAGNPFLKLTQGGPEMNEAFNAQLAMQEKINPMSITSGILALLVAIPMTIAGIQMLRKRRNGLKWSNAYALSSIGAKVINLALTVIILVPAMEEMTRGMMAKAPMPGPVSGAMSGIMAGSAIIGVVVTAVYPILALVLLNRPAIKEWFAGLPE